jgi:hypothetical protein
MTLAMPYGVKTTGKRNPTARAVGAAVGGCTVFGAIVGATARACSANVATRMADKAKLSGGSATVRRRAGSRLQRGRPLDRLALGRFQVSLEEVIQERADHGDSPKLADVLPRRGDDAADDVRRELELEAEEEPQAEPAPDHFALAVRGGGRHDDPQQPDKRRRGSVGDQQDRRRFDEQRNHPRDVDEELLHGCGAAIARHLPALPGCPNQNRTFQPACTCVDVPRSPSLFTRSPARNSSRKSARGTGVHAIFAVVRCVRCSDSLT